MSGLASRLSSSKAGLPGRPWVHRHMGCMPLRGMRSATVAQAKEKGKQKEDSEFCH